MRIKKKWFKKKLNEIRNGAIQRLILVKSSKGELLIQEDEVKDRCREYIEEHLNEVEVGEIGDSESSGSEREMLL